MKLFLADILYILHFFVFLPVVLTFIYKSGPWLKYNIIILPIILSDWYDYDDQCSLTSLEAKLRGTWKPGAPEMNEDTPAFFQPLLNKILKPFGIQVSRKTAGKINILLFLTALLVSFIRYLLFKKISLLPKTFIGKIYIKLIFLFCFLYIINFFI